MITFIGLLLMFYGVKMWKDAFDWHDIKEFWIGFLVMAVGTGLLSAM